MGHPHRLNSEQEIPTGYWCQKYQNGDLIFSPVNFGILDYKKILIK